MKRVNYKKLKFFKLAQEIVVESYSLTKDFPNYEQGFTGIVNQIRRATVSVVSNIAEGSSRNEKEFVHFLSISLGSLRELDSQINISKNLNFINEAKFNEISEKIDECSGRLCNYMKTIYSSINKNN